MILIVDLEVVACTNVRLKTVERELFVNYKKSEDWGEDYVYSERKEISMFGQILYVRSLFNTKERLDVVGCKTSTSVDIFWFVFFCCVLVFWVVEEV